MIKLQRWQWLVLALPPVAVLLFLLAAAGVQLRTWHLNWIWAVVILVLVAWRWLLVRWTRPGEIAATVLAIEQELQEEAEATASQQQDLEASLQPILTAAREDAPIWDDWGQFWQRCQTVVSTVAHHYHPEVKYPLLNIYVPQAYGLIRGTVDDTDRAMTQLAPVLNQVSVGQVYEAYELYQRLEPSMGKLWRAWNWAQWLLNPAAAAARTLSQRSTTQANQQLLVNLSQLLRETALRNLAQQTAALYGGDELPAIFGSEAEATTEQTTTLKAILEEAEPAEAVAQKPVTVMLVGRTGAGKSSLINTLFKTERAAVDVLPSTDQIDQYRWQLPTGEALELLDSPGYEQVQGEELRQLVVEQSGRADLVILVTPALDPALESDRNFLNDVTAGEHRPPTAVALTQVDRLRPPREWQPPYDWRSGDRTKEKSIREAVAYRRETLGLETIPLVTRAPDRRAWNDETLALELVNALGEAKQYRLAQFLQNQTAQAEAAAKLIRQYATRVSTSQGIAELLKSPILRYLSRLMTGSDLLATALMDKVPVEQAPMVIGKLQLAYDLFQLVAPAEKSFDLLELWPVLMSQGSAPPETVAAFGQGVVAYYLGQQPSLEQAVEHYLERPEEAA